MFLRGLAAQLKKFAPNMAEFSTIFTVVCLEVGGLEVGAM
jgi:hypothetical protein